MMARWLAWSLWPLFALFVVGAGVVLLPACGVATPFTATVLPALGWNFCPVTSSALSNEAQRQAELGKRIAELQLELSRRQLAYVSVAPVTLPPLDLPTEAGPPQPQQTAELKPRRRRRCRPSDGRKRTLACWRGVGSSAAIRRPRGPLRAAPNAARSRPASCASAPTARAAAR